MKGSNQNQSQYSEKPGSNVSEIDKDIWELHNKIRANPSCILSDLEEYMSSYEREFFIKRKGRTTIRTIEGTKAV